MHRRGGNFSHPEFAVPSFGKDPGVASGTATMDRRQSTSLGLQLAGATPFCFMKEELLITQRRPCKKSMGS